MQGNEGVHNVLSRMRFPTLLPRRAFLAGALAAALPSLRSRVSAITDEIAFTPAEAFDFCRQYGLKWIELRHVPGTKQGYWDLPPAAQREFARQVRGQGLGVSFIDSALLAAPLPGTTPLRTPSPAEAERYARRGEQLDRVLALAGAVGCGKIRCFGFRRVAEPRSLFPRIAEEIAPLAEIAGRAGVRLLIENESSCNVATCADIAEFSPLLPSPWFGFNWDPGNAVREEEAYPAGYALLPVSRIGNVQVKGKGILPGGTERVDWGGILASLRRDGYAGCIGLETHTPQRQADSHPAMRELLRLAGAQ